jgi:hypothetical protein
MTGFQHVHPTQRADGSWSVPVELADAGAYRVFADFSVDETAHTLAADLSVDGPIRATPFPTPATSVLGLRRLRAHRRRRFFRGSRPPAARVLDRRPRARWLSPAAAAAIGNRRRRARSAPSRH